MSHARRRLDPPRLYGIACGDALGLAAVDDAVVAMAEAGVRWIQLRLKSATDRERYRVTATCAERLGSLEHPPALWMDDRADLALLFADAIAGVHVGQDDLPPAAVRRVLGESTWIGRSCHDLEQVRAVDLDADVDVVAVGPVFATRSKAHPDPTIGLGGVERARQETRKPLVAIGGIDASNARAVLDAGADTVVMLGALCRGDESGAAGIGQRSRRLVELVETSVGTSQVREERR